VKRFTLISPRTLITFVTMAFALAMVCVPLLADAVSINGLTIDKTDDGEALIFSINGYARPQLEVLPDIGAVKVTFKGAQVAEGFLIPNLENTAAISKINYKLGLSDETREVTFTFFVTDSFNLTDSSCRIEEKEGQAILVLLDQPAIGEPRDLLAPTEKSAEPEKPVAPEKPAYLTEIVSIDIGTHPSGEMVTMKTTNSAVPIIREFSFPKRIAVEIEGGYLTDELVDKFLYEDPSGLISKVDLFVSPMEDRGVFQMIITAPQMSYYEMKSQGDTTFEFFFFKGQNQPVPLVTETAPEPVVQQATPVIAEVEPQVAPEPVEVTPEPVTSVEERTVAADEVEYEDIPVAEEEPQRTTDALPQPISGSVGYSLGYGDDSKLLEETVPPTEVTGIDDEIEYPDLPVDKEGTEWDFPEMETSKDINHISDAIVSLNFENASFISVMRILAAQAGVNYVLDAYWAETPTGHTQNRAPGGGIGMPSGGGFQPGGGWNPAIGGGGSVTMFLQEVPFDEAFDLLMKANGLDYKVFRATPDAEPILFISTRARLETELGLGVIRSYQLHYIPPDSALQFLVAMDLLPITSNNFGYWRYNGSGGTGGGSGSSGGSSGGSGGWGSSGGGGSSSGGGGGGGGGYGSAPYPGGVATFPDGTPDYSKPMNMSQMAETNGVVGTPMYNNNGAVPMQFGGGGGGRGGGSGSSGGGSGSSGGGSGGFGGGGGQQYTAKGGVIAIMASPEMHTSIEAALNQVDKPPKQVYIETIFVNSDKNPIKTPRVYGIENFGQWAFEGGGDRFFGQFDVTGTEGLVFSILPKNQSVPYEDFRMRFQYLFDDRYARIVTAPRVAVLDGYTATVGVNEQRPFIVDGGIIIDQFGNAIPAPDQVTMLPTGTTLTVTPYIDDYGNITMNLSPNQSQPLGEPQLINGNLVWGTVNNQVNTTLRMRDGETIVLGGMTTRNRDVNKKYVPLLGDIPIIGQLFGRTTIIEIESQLVILMTVHLVGD
jgi:hypothetical protein